MTVNRGLFVRQTGTGGTAVGTTPLEARLAMAGLLTHNSSGNPRSGVLDPTTDTLVTGSSSDMSYNVVAHNPVISRAANEGVYMPTLTGTTNVPTGAAPGSGSRWDLIWVKQNDTEKGDPDNLAYIGVEQGTAATSPAKPTASVPQGALVLAEALVQTAAPNTNSALVTITQVFPFTTVRGGILTVRNSTERGTITPIEGQRVRRRDLSNVIETYRAGQWFGITPAAITSTYTGWVKGTGAATPRLWTPDGNTVHMSGVVQFTTGAAGNIFNVPANYLPVDSSLRYVGTSIASNGSGDPVNGAVVELLMEDGIVRIGYQSKSVALNSFLPLHGTWYVR